MSLDRSPVLLSNAMPDDLVCVFDEDDNGLDDKIEEQIAQAFVPQFRFDVAEEHTKWNEPHAVFTMRAALDDDGSRVLTVQYMFVWDEDGGWVNDSTPGCGDAHAGDTQSMTATVRLVEGTQRWYARLERLSGFVALSNEFADDQLLHVETHPIVCPSAGKHHFYPYRDQYTYEHTGPDCTENAWGNGFSRTPLTEHVPDPESIDTAGLAPAQGANTSVKSRRLRAGHDTTEHALTSSYSYFDGGLYGCPAFNFKYMVHVRWPDEIIHWPEGDLRAPLDIILAAEGPTWSETYLLRGNARQAVSVAVNAEIADTWVAMNPGLTAPLTDVTRDVVLAEAMSDGGPQDLRGLPNLLRVAQGGDAARWAVLRAVQFDGQTVTYGMSDSGELPVGVGEGVRLVADQLGTLGALVDSARGEVFGFEPVLKTWLRAHVPPDAAAALDSGILALVGSNLIVLSSQPDDSQHAPGWVIDIHGREATALPAALPARTEAKLVLSTDRSALLLVGGADRAGQLHDDVWSLPIPMGDQPWGAAKRARPDSANPHLVSSAAAVVTGSADGAELRAWATAVGDGAGLVTPLMRTDRGWLELDAQGVPVAATCPEGDVNGGQLCRVNDAWWASAGTSACSDAPEPGRCEGTTGELLFEASLHTQRIVVDAVTDGSTVWVLTRSSLHRLRADATGQLHELAVAQLATTGRALATSAPQVLIGTDDGVHVVEMRDGSLVVGPERELCGRPLRIVPVAGSLWAVSTTLGTAVVSTGFPGAPVVLSTSMVLPIPSGTGSTYPLPTEGAALQACRDVDKLLGEGAVTVLAELSALAAASSKRVLVVRGPFVVELDVSDARLPVAQHTVDTGTALRWLRVDMIGERAYGLGVGLPSHRKPVLDLRGGGLHLAGQHDIPKWVRRSDARRLSVDVLGLRHVKVAEVAR